MLNKRHIFYLNILQYISEIVVPDFLVQLRAGVGVVILDITNYLYPLGSRKPATSRIKFLIPPN